MFSTSLTRVLTNYRTYWSLGTLVLVTFFLTLVFDSLLPRITHYATLFGLPVSVILFFFGFIMLHRNQESEVGE